MTPGLLGSAPRALDGPIRGLEVVDVEREALALRARRTRLEHLQRLGPERRCRS